jgi:peptide/nickel transport system substrate-binding protein
MFIKLNDMVVNDQVVIPVVARPAVQAISNQLQAAMSGWDNNTWDIQNWYKET